MSSPITRVLLTSFILNFFMEKSVEIKDKYRTAIPKFLIHHCVQFNTLERLSPKSLIDFCGQIQLFRESESSTNTVTTQLFSPDKHFKMNKKSTTCLNPYTWKLY